MSTIATPLAIPITPSYKQKVARSRAISEPAWIRWLLIGFALALIVSGLIGLYVMGSLIGGVLDLGKVGRREGQRFRCAGRDNEGSDASSGESEDKH